MNGRSCFSTGVCECPRRLSINVSAFTSNSFLTYTHPWKHEQWLHLSNFMDAASNRRWTASIIIQTVWMVRKTLQDVVVVLLLIGVVFAASDASRLVCEYQCAESADHRHAVPEANGSVDLGTAVHHHDHDTPLTSDSAIVSSRSTHGNDCGPVDSIIVGINQQITNLTAPVPHTAANPVVTGAGIVNTLSTDANLPGLQSHGPPLVPLGSFTTLRI